MKLKLSEYFYSIQGEGRSAGKPAAFIRFGYCNLSCHFCDSAYTWNTKSYDLSQEIREIEVDTLVDWLTYEVPAHARIVLTGGEPLLKMHAGGQVELLQRLCKAGQHRYVEVETAGTLIPDSMLDPYINHYTVSPKLSSSSPSPDSQHEKNRFNIVVLKYFGFLRDRADFKFVVSEDVDINEILRDFISILPFVDGSRVYLMPKGVGIEELNKLTPEVMKACLKHGFNFTTRLHIYGFGNTRGT